VADPPDRIARRSAQVDAVALFSVMWALAAVWHLLGNPTIAPAWSQALLTLGVGAVLLRPGAALPLGGLALAGLVTVWEEAPFLGNHWLLAGFVNLGILAAVVTGALRGRAHDRLDLANRVLPMARLSLLGFYVFAGFAKLNSAFLDRSVSCAVFYYRESTDSVGLTGLQLGGAAWVEHLVILGTVAVELSIPVLLVVRRTRRVGVVVALVFHTVLAVDHGHQFFDFSSVLFALFVLFLPPDAGSWVAERLGSVRARLALRDEQVPERAHLALVAVPVLAGLLVSLDVFTRTGALQAGWWPWQVYALVTIVAAARFLQQAPAEASVRLAPHHALFALVPLLVVLNGITPYAEVKTGYGWNMYANLRTVDGETNHLVVPRTFPLTDEQADLVEILDSDAPALAWYAANDYALTWRALRTYVSERPDVRLRYRRGNAVVSLARAGDDPELVAPVPEWRDKVQLFRAVDLRSPERCTPYWGPAR
jgi:hypothetical protein